jgi:hypothetical protein
MSNGAIHARRIEVVEDHLRAEVATEGKGGDPLPAVGVSVIARR